MIVKRSKNKIFFPKIRFVCFGKVRQSHNRLLRKFNSLISTLLCYCETEDLKASFCIILSCVQPSISAFETFFSVTFRNARSLCNCVVITSKLSSRLLKFSPDNFYHLLASFFTRFCIFVKRHSVIWRHICYRFTQTFDQWYWTGLATNSIQFCWFFTIKDRVVEKCVFVKTHN